MYFGWYDSCALLVSPREAACPPTSHCCSGTAGNRSCTPCLRISPSPLLLNGRSAYPLLPSFNCIHTALDPRPDHEYLLPAPQQNALPFAAAGWGLGARKGHVYGESMLSGGVHPRAACASVLCPPGPSVKSRKKALSPDKAPVCCMHTP